MIWTILAQLYWGYVLARETTQHCNCRTQPLSPHPHDPTWSPLPEPAPTAGGSAILYLAASGVAGSFDRGMILGK